MAVPPRGSMMKEPMSMTNMVTMPMSLTLALPVGEYLAPFILARLFAGT